jgi:hypothetical protein
MMNNVMEWLKKYFKFALIGSALVFTAGFSAWHMARHYQPEVPIEMPLRHYNTAKKEPVPPFSRYQSLSGGSMFFGENIKSSDGAFQSRLVLWGLISNAWAVVGEDPNSSQNTWIVKAGDTVAGEQIVAVGVRYIVVRNQSGEGKVRMSE